MNDSILIKMNNHTNWCSVFLFFFISAFNRWKDAQSGSTIFFSPHPHSAFLLRRWCRATKNVFAFPNQIFVLCKNQSIKRQPPHWPPTTIWSTRRNNDLEERLLTESRGKDKQWNLFSGASLFSGKASLSHCHTAQLLLLPIHSSGHRPPFNDARASCFNRLLLCGFRGALRFRRKWN